MARVLVMENHPMIRDLLCLVLEQAGYEVAEAQDRLECMQLFRQQPADLVIIDFCLPKKDGFETIVELRRDFPGVGIIAVSGDDRNDIHILGVAQFLGADHVMKKPMDMINLLEIIGKVLTGRRTAERTQPQQDVQAFFAPETILPFRQAGVA